MDLGLTGKRALVTGGTRGIGRAIALAFASEGVRVAAAHFRDSEDSASTATELEKAGNGSYTVKADLGGGPEAIHGLADAVVDRFGGIDILVNNASVVSHMPLDMPPEEWSRVIDINLTAVFLLCRAVVPHMPDGGSIINISAAGAMVGIPLRSHYTASKAAVNAFSRSLCKELGKRQIRVNVLAPGIVDTHQAAGLTPEMRARYAGMSALGRLGEEDDIAGPALFLASDLAKFVDGAILNVDGGS
jgi:NAD(P)-dependent dehydrogenase (short-subunit alcohol dehydrogenase family)